MRQNTSNLRVPTPDANPTDARPPADALVFTSLLFLSGLCGLSYEVLYARVLGNVIGDTLTVSAAILMTFLLGIGIGTRCAYRLWRHLWIIEAAIGGCGVLFAWSIPWLDSIFYGSMPLLGSGTAGSVLICALILAVPAFLIGCSLPLFAGYLSELQSAKMFAPAYAVYNLGAALTVLLIEFWLIRRLGLRWSLVSIAAVNLATAAVLRLRFDELRQTVPTQTERSRFSMWDRAALWLVSVGSAVFQLMMIKSAECLFGPFHETFALVLAIVLLGVAAGAWCCDRFRLGLTRVLLVNLIGLGWYLGGLELVAHWYAAWYPTASEHYISSVLLKFVALVCVMGGPALSFGATIPAVFQQQSDVSRASGQLLFVSCLGNAAGFLLMALVLHRHLDYGGITLFVSCLTVVGVCLSERMRPRRLMITAVCLAGVVGVWHSVWNENLLYLGHTAFHSTEDLEEASEDLQHPQRFKGNRDVFAINWIDDRPYFFINGYLSIPLSSPSEKIVGAFSSMFAPRNDRALVLGVGSGATAGTTGLLFDDVDAVEINPAVLDNLHRMSKYSFDIRSNSHVRIVQDDAIHFTKASQASYSLIINTVTTPLYFSSSKLYTRDFFETVRRRLSPGGVYVTWVDSRVGDRGLDIVLNTISESFDHCAMGCVKSSYFLLLCSDEPIRVRQPTLVSENSRLREYFLDEHGIAPTWLPYGLLLQNAFTLKSGEPVETNTLDFPSLEFEMARLRRRGIAEFKKRLRSQMSVDNSRRVLADAMDWDPHQLLLHVQGLLGDSTITDRWAQLVASESKDFILGLKQADAEYHRIRAGQLRTADARHKYGYRLMRLKKYAAAIAEFQDVLALDPRRDNSHFNMAACYEYLEMYEQALEHYRLEHIVDPTDDSVPYRIARVSLQVGDFQQALTAIDTAIRIRSDGENHRLRGRALEGLDRPIDALEAYRRALTLDAKDVLAEEGRRRMEGLLQSEVGQADIMP